MNTFNTENTDGYSAEQLDRANKIFDRIKNNIAEHEIKNIQERILRHVK